MIKEEHLSKIKIKGDYLEWFYLMCTTFVYNVFVIVFSLETFYKKKKTEKNLAVVRYKLKVALKVISEKQKPQEQVSSSTSRQLPPLRFNLLTGFGYAK